MKIERQYLTKGDVLEKHGENVEIGGKKWKKEI